MISWAICLKEPQNFIGTIGFYRTQFEHFRTEVGYELHPDFWRKGLASEALQTVLDYTFSETRVHSVEANIDPDNFGPTLMALGNLANDIVIQEERLIERYPKILERLKAF